nr:MAG TPA: transcriptional regulator [Caudoviricetes sp.]
MRRAAAGMKTSTLVGMLDRRGWAGTGLRAGQRMALRALVELLPYGSGTGRATTAQVADAAGWAQARTASRHLAALAEAGIIQWVRGYVDHGTPVPSWFRIDKDLLATLANAAVEPHRERLARRRTETRERLACLSHVRRILSKTPNAIIEFRKVWQGQTGGLHGARNADLTPRRGETRSGSHPCTSNHPTSKDNDAMAMTRLPDPPIARLAGRRCPHKDPKGPAHCALCRFNALHPEQQVQWQEEHGPQPMPMPMPSTGAREEALATMRAIAAAAGGRR